MKLKTCHLDQKYQIYYFNMSFNIEYVLFKLKDWLIAYKVYNRLWGDYLKEYAYNLLKQEVKSYQDLREFKHDFLNHINIIKLYLQMGMVDKSLDYIDKLANFVDKSSTYQKITDNLELDMLLSSKIKKIHELDCEIDISSNVNSKLNLDIFDIVSILGNLLDNSYEALINAKEKRLSVDINIIYDNLYICVINTHNNSMITYGNDILTSKKEDTQNHGIGIKSIKNCVTKNNGEIIIEYDDKEFSTEIYIPLKNEIDYTWDKKAW